ALAAHLGERHLDAALLAGDAAELHALVLAAQALVVLDRSEDAGAEQAVTLRLERAVVDGLRLLDLAVAPGADAVGAGAHDTDLVESRRALRLAKYVDEVGHLCVLRFVGRIREWRVQPASFSGRLLIEFDVEAQGAQL